MHEGTKKNNTKKNQESEKMDRKRKCEQNSSIYLLYSKGILKWFSTKIDFPSFCMILSTQNFSILATFPITHIYLDTHLGDGGKG